MKLRLVAIAFLLAMISLIGVGADAVNEVKCERLFEQQDPCSFAKIHCQEVAGFVNYVQDYYCFQSDGSRWFLFALDLCLLVALFVFISTAAGDFFCPNLNTIASYLGMSENLTGVTFLALGNGAPDLFASFSAIQQGSAGLAIGELLGAGSFIVTCVVGAVAITSGFRVTRRPFLRDVGFFLLAVIVLMVVLYDEQITMTESILLVSLYVLYVLVVAIGRAVYQWQKRKRIERLMFQRANSIDIDENALIEDADIKLAAEIEDTDKLLDISTEEYTEHTSSPTAPGIFLTNAIANNYDPWFFKHKTVSSLRRGYINQTRSLNDRAGLYSRVRFKSSPSVFNEGTSSTISRPGSGDLLMNDIQDDPVGSGSMNRKKQASANETILDDLDELEERTADTESIVISINDSKRSPRLQLGTEPWKKDWATIKKELLISLPSFKTLTRTLWPFLDTWNEQTKGERILSILSIPASFLLCLTVPVVDSSIDYRDGRHESESETPVQPTWPRWLFIVHAFVIPIFAVSALNKWSSFAFGIFSWGAIAILFSAAFTVFAICFTSPFAIPRFHPLLCAVGFATAILWIYNVAHELLALLKSVGIILHVSESILGLTVLAIGNSIADLVADVTIAKMGFPNMAIAACFGGPMLNILLGVGVSSLYYNVMNPESYKLKFTRTLFMSSIGLMVALVASLIYVPMNNWKGSKTYGVGLIAVYGIIMITNLIMELTSNH